MLQLKIHPKSLFTNTFIIYFLSYVIVILIPVLTLTVFSYNLTVKALTDETVTSFLNASSLAASSINSKFKEMQELLIITAMDGNLIIAAKNEDNGYELMQITNTFNKIIAQSNQYIYSMKAYLPSNDTLVQSSGIIMNKQEASYESNWINSMEKEPENKVWLSANRINDLKGQYINTLTMSIKFPWGYKKQLGYLSLNIYENSIYKLLDQIKQNKDANIFLINNQGKILSCKDKTKLMTAIFPENIVEKVFGNEQYGHFISNKDIVFYSRENLNEQAIIMTISNKYFIRKISAMKSTMTLAFLLLLAFGIFISLFISKKMYKPIEKIAATLLAKKSLLSDEKTDIFTFINSQLENTINDNDRLEKLFQSSLPALKEKFISNLLINSLLNDNYIHKSIDSYSLDLSNKYYVVVLMEIDNYLDLSSKFSTTDLGLFNATIKNLAAESFRKKFICYATELDATHNAYLLNFNDTVTSFKQEIDIINNKIIEDLKELINVSVTISVGSICTDIKDASLSYMNAKKILKYKLPLGNKRIIYYTNVSDIKDVHLSPYNDTINFIINNVQSGNIEKVIDYLKQIRLDIEEKKYISIDAIQRVYGRILDESLELYSIRCNNLDKLLNNRSDLYVQLYQKESLDKIDVYITQILTRICQYISDENMNKNDMINKALQYINEHFRKDIGLQIVADYINITPAYFSRTFKKATGKTFINYLHSKRIDASIELLQKTDMRIADISEAVGYNTPQSFIKFFKKYTGITPSEYRNSHIV